MTVTDDVCSGAPSCIHVRLSLILYQYVFDLQFAEPESILLS